MEESFSDIQDNIDCLDKEGLEKSIEIIDEILKEENDRRKSAEDRANYVITMSGIASGVIVFFGKNITGYINDNSKYFIYLLLGFSVWLLFKSIYSSIQSVRISIDYFLDPTLIYENTESSDIEYLKDELANKIYIYNKKIDQVNRKLYYFDRGINNLLFSLVSILLVPLIIIYNKIIEIDVSITVVVIISIILTGIVLGLDKIQDKFGFWDFG